MTELICLLIAAGAALLITIPSIYISSQGGNWEDFFRGRLKRNKQERASKRLDAETEALLAEYDARRKRGRIIWFYCIGGTFGFTIITALVYAILRLVFGREVIDENTVNNSAIKELPTQIALGYLGAVVLFTIAYYLINIRRVKVSPQHEAQAQGIVAEVKLLSESEGTTSVGRNETVTTGQRNKLYIIVKTEKGNKIMKTTASFSQGKQVRGRRFERGDKVTVVYDTRKPKRCRIV